MKKAFIFLFLIGLLQGALYAQTFHRMIEQEKQRGELSESRAVYLEALRAFRPDLLPEKYRTDDPPLKCGVGLLRRVRKHLPDWDGRQKEVMQAFLQRPELPLSHASPSGLFRIHYAVAGKDRDENL